jgi:hypothetical protein
MIGSTERLADLVRDVRDDQSLHHSEDALTRHANGLCLLELAGTSIASCLVLPYTSIRSDRSGSLSSLVLLVASARARAFGTRRVRSSPGLNSGFVFGRPPLRPAMRHL